MTFTASLSGMPLQGPVDRQRLSDVAFVRLRRAIVSGELSPGLKLNDSQLAADLGLSRTPVREALSRLVDAGLVEAKPGAHTRVTPLSREDVEATLSVLEALDRLAVLTAVPRLERGDMAKMRRAHREFSAAVRGNDVAAALQADAAFHKVIMDAASNPVLTRLVDMIHPRVERIVYRKFKSLLGRRDTVEHHARLVQLCAAGDAERAAGLSAEHWRHLGGLIGDLFDNAQLESAG
jgi:DNA-binding GntR family transcriptional regulator